MSEKNDNKVPNVPNLRFSSSILDWELKPITTLIEECSETTSNFEKYPLYSFTIEDGVVPKSERYERSFLVKKDGDSFKVVKYNNFVMNPMNLRFGAISYSKVKNDVSVSGYYNIFNIDNAQCNDYWEALFRRTKTLQLYDSVATGSLLEKKRVHFSQFRSLKFYIPEYNERIKISLFFSKINERIDTQSKIIEDLILEKNITSDKIFSQTPICKNSLSSFYKKGKAGGTPKSTNKSYYGGDIPFLSISDMTEQGKYLYSTQKTLTKEGLENSTAWVVPKDSLILSMYASVGQVAINKIPLATSQAMFSMTIIDKNDLVFLYYFLSYFRENKLHKYLETGTQSNINADFVKSIEIPDYGAVKNEQIVTLLSLLDERIQKEKDILSLYKKQKAYLLNNMFI